MRHQYTPIFRDLLDSSLWASSTPATRCTWITFLLDADPEGFIPTSIPGLARRAHVTVEEARAAVALLEAPDPDSRTPDFEGRRIRKVDHGWQVINFVAWRERAKLEAEKARKRKWAAANGKPKPANDTYDASSTSAPASNLDASSETLDAPKPKPKPKPSLSEEGSGSPSPVRASREDGTNPRALGTNPRATGINPRAIHTDIVDGTETGGGALLPAVIRKLSEWVPKEGELDALRDAAKLAGVKNFDRWFAQLGSGPIGGARGVLPDMVGDYLHGQFARWRQWEETDALKDANSRAAAAAPRSFRGGPLPPQGPQRERVQGAPEWVYVEHAQFARQHAMKLGPAAKEFAESYHLGDPSTLKPADVFGPFMKFLQDRANRKESA